MSKLKRKERESDSKEPLENHSTTKIKKTESSSFSDGKKSSSQKKIITKNKKSLPEKPFADYNYDEYLKEVMETIRALKKIGFIRECLPVLKNSIVRHFIEKYPENYTLFYILEMFEKHDKDGLFTYYVANSRNMEAVFLVNFNDSLTDPSYQIINLVIIDILDRMPATEKFKQIIAEIVEKIVRTLFLV
jgi:hypothetical protein